MPKISFFEMRLLIQSCINPALAAQQECISSAICIQKSFRMSQKIIISRSKSISRQTFGARDAEIDSK
jgi:hypothetical protein